MGHPVLKFHVNLAEVSLKNLSRILVFRLGNYHPLYATIQYKNTSIKI